MTTMNQDRHLLHKTKDTLFLVKSDTLETNKPKGKSEHILLYLSLGFYNIRPTIYNCVKAHFGHCKL